MKKKERRKVAVYDTVLADWSDEGDKKGWWGGENAGLGEKQHLGSGGEALREGGAKNQFNAAVRLLLTTTTP